MSTYMRMWEHVKSLTSPERIQLLADLRPAKGIGVHLPNGAHVCDVDLIEALSYMEDSPS